MSDLRGKYVVIDFWPRGATLQAGIAAVNSIYDRFGSSRRVVLGMCLDGAADRPIAYAREKGYGWSHVFLGAWQNTDVPKRFGVRGIPAMFLVSPQGKILAVNISPADAESTLERLTTGRLAGLSSTLRFLHRALSRHSGNIPMFHA